MKQTVDLRRQDVYQVYPWNEHLWKGREEAEGKIRTDEGPVASLTKLMKNFRARKTLHKCPKLGPRWPSPYTPTLIKPWMGAAQGKGHDLGRGSSLQLRQTPKGLTAEDYLQPALPAAGSTKPSGKEFLGHVSQCPPQWETPGPASSPLEMLERMYFF